MSRHLAPITLLALGAACSHESSKSNETFGFTHVEGVNVTLETMGVRIEVDGSVQYRSLTSSSASGASTSASTFDGHPFGIRDGVFFIGEREYGAVREGSVVQVSERGVSVDGEERGPLPAPVLEASK